MDREVAVKVVKASSSAVAMVLIWRLVETAMAAGIDGVMFFGGVAAIAGLGGYNIKWLKDTVQSKVSRNSSAK